MQRPRKVTELCDESWIPNGLTFISPSMCPDGSTPVHIRTPLHIGAIRSDTRCLVVVDFKDKFRHPQYRKLAKRLAALQQLETVAFDSCRYLTSDLLKELLRSQPIRRLALNECPLIDDADFLGSDYARWTHLKLSSCLNSSGKGLIEAARATALASATCSFLKWGSTEVGRLLTGAQSIDYLELFHMSTPPAGVAYRDIGCRELRAQWMQGSLAGVARFIRAQSQLAVIHVEDAVESELRAAEVRDLLEAASTATDCHLGVPSNTSQLLATAAAKLPGSLRRLSIGVICPSQMDGDPWVLTSALISRISVLESLEQLRVDWRGDPLWPLIDEFAAALPRLHLDLYDHDELAPIPFASYQAGKRVS